MLTANISKKQEKTIIYDSMIGKELEVTCGKVSPGEIVQAGNKKYMVYCGFASICGDKPGKCLGCGNIYAGEWESE